MRSRRFGVSILVALCGAAIAAGAVMAWVDARGPRPASGIEHTAISGLLHFAYQPSGSFLRSFGMVITVCGALVFLGGLVASRFLAALFSVIALTVAALWIGLNAQHYSPTNLPYSDLRIGAWLTIGGGVIALLSAVVMRRVRT